MSEIPPGESDGCFICGLANPELLEGHHTVPRRKGGSDAPENMVTLCSRCHTAVERIYDEAFWVRAESRIGEASLLADNGGYTGTQVPAEESIDREIPGRRTVNYTWLEYETTKGNIRFGLSHQGGPNTPLVESAVCARDLISTKKEQFGKEGISDKEFVEWYSESDHVANFPTVEDADGNDDYDDYDEYTTSASITKPTPKSPHISFERFFDAFLSIEHVERFMSRMESARRDVVDEVWKSDAFDDRVYDVLSDNFDRIGAAMEAEEPALIKLEPEDPRTEPHVSVFNWEWYGENGPWYNSDHVRMHCNYCRTVFGPHEDEAVARHLRLRHHIEDPYDVVISEVGMGSLTTPPHVPLGPREEGW